MPKKLIDIHSHIIFGADDGAQSLTEAVGLAGAARDCAAEYISLLASAPDCDPAEKQAKSRHFAESLLASGGPAVDQVTKLFGRETAERLILRHMYGVR